MHETQTPCYRQSDAFDRLKTARKAPFFLKRLQREADFASLAAVSQIRVALTIKRMRGREDVSTE